MRVLLALLLLAALPAATLAWKEHEVGQGRLEDDMQAQGRVSALCAHAALAAREPGGECTPHTGLSALLMAWHARHALHAGSVCGQEAAAAAAAQAPPRAHPQEAHALCALRRCRKGRHAHAGELYSGLQIRSRDIRTA